MKSRFVLAFLFVSLAISGQEVRVASYNMERLGQNHKDYATLAKVIASFDVVAAEEVMNESGASRVLARLGVSWSDYVSLRGEGSKRYQEHFGFFYDHKLELARNLGEYAKAREFIRPPYGVEFRVKASGFTFNLVACHIIYGTNEKDRVEEISHLEEVYQYFEGMTENKSTTVIVGDFNEDKPADFAPLTANGDFDAVPDEGTTIGTRGPDHFYDHIFIPSSLRSRVEKADVDYWTSDYRGSRNNESDHFPVYVVLNTR